VGAQQQPITGWSSAVRCGKTSDEIAMLVTLYFAAERRYQPCQFRADGFFLPRRAINRDQIQERLNQTSFVDQDTPLIERGSKAGACAQVANK
jgi:hypothetical protein